MTRCSCLFTLFVAAFMGAGCTAVAPASTSGVTTAEPTATATPVMTAQATPPPTATPTEDTETAWAVHMVTALDDLVPIQFDEAQVVDWATQESHWLRTDVNVAPEGPFLEYFESIIDVLSAIEDGSGMKAAVDDLLALRPELATYADGLVPVVPPDDPEPPFTELKLTGRGSKVVKFDIPEDVAIVKITGKSTSNFVVWSIDADGEENDLLVNEIGNYTGTVLLDADLGVKSVAFKIESNGNWTLVLRPLSSARRWDPAVQLTGKGDDVVVVDPSPEPLTIVALKHSGESNFAIWAYGSDDTDLLVNEIGRYAGETLLSSDLLLLEVTADGAWSITPQ